MPSSMHRASCNAPSMHSSLHLSMHHQNAPSMHTLHQMHQFRSFSSSFIISASSVHLSMHHQCIINALSVHLSIHHQYIINTSSVYSVTRIPESGNLGLWNREREMFARGIRFRSVIKLKESANVWNLESKFH